jgi:phospholipase C
VTRREPGPGASERQSALKRAAAEERLAAEHPYAFMRRREFLARTAAAAGAAGLATTLPSETLIAEAAKRQRRSLPKPHNLPIDTFVVLMMENRSFDHYFGWHPDADSENAGLTYPDAQGNPVATYHLPPDFQGCGFKDPDHSWTGGRHQYNDGAMDGFVQGNAEGDGSDQFAAGYYLKEDLGFIPHAADAFTLYDRFFHSLMASTYPNRHYQWSAQNGGQKSNDIPFPEGLSDAPGNDWETIFDRALARGITATYYNSDLPFSALYGTRGLSWTRPIADFYEQAAAGTLPNICFVDPPFRDGGGGDGTSADEHPHGDIRLGQAFMSDVVHAFMESPQYERGVLFIDYDEWGGFFEHVRPRRVPDDRASTDITEDWGLTGFRVPAVAVSPYTRGGGVSHAFATFESILKLISYRFDLGFLNKRHRYATNIGRTFDFTKQNVDPPQLPDPEAIAATPCFLQSLGGKTQGEARPKPHDMALLETTGYLDLLGYEVKPSSYDRIFREPDSVRQALRRSTRR